MLIEGIAVAGYHIERGVRTFDAYAEAMVNDLGDGIRPYLVMFYEGIRLYPGMEEIAKDMTPMAEVHALRAQEGSGRDRIASISSMLPASMDSYSKAWMKTEARQYWRRYLPRLFRRLKDSGELEAALDDVATRARVAMDALQIQAHLTPDEAWPEVRHEWILLDPARYNQ